MGLYILLYLAAVNSQPRKDLSLVDQGKSYEIINFINVYLSVMKLPSCASLFDPFVGVPLLDI